MALALAGCGTYVPDGATVISVKNSKQEFERGELRPPQNELREMSIIKMRWYDDNTFLTTATLEPGVYSFLARNYEGAAIQRDIAIVKDKDYYEITAERSVAEKGAEATPEVAGPQIKGRILSAQAGRISSVSVLFVGTDVVLRTAQVARDGSFTVESPRPGNWKIEIHRLGPNPVSYVHPVTNVTRPVDLGQITLR